MRREGQPRRRRQLRHRLLPLSRAPLRLRLLLRLLLQRLRRGRLR